jgi:Zn-finger nucleic acid-binding protein
MQCPNKNCNHEELKEMMIVGIKADYCPKCFGMWFEKGEFDSAKNAKDMSLRWMDIDLWKDKKLFDAKYSHRTCPKDRSLLYEVSYADSDVKVDVCNLCQGIWLDRGEFDKLLSYLQTKNKKELINNYGKILAQEVWEVFSGPKETREELIDLISVLKVLQYKFASQNDWIAKFIMSLPKL